MHENSRSSAVIEMLKPAHLVLTHTVVKMTDITFFLILMVDMNNKATDQYLHDFKQCTVDTFSDNCMNE